MAVWYQDKPAMNHLRPRLAGFLCLLLLVPGAARAGEKPDLWFPVGETLTYRVYWGVLVVGEGTVSTEWVEEEGRSLVAIRVKARSNRIISALYPVDFFIESLVDPVTFLPARFTQKSRTGRQRADEVTRFDYDAGKAHWESFIRERKKEYAIDRETRDLLSFMYYVRGQDDCFQEGITNRFKVMENEKVYNLFMTPVKQEKIDVPGYGEIECSRFEPSATFNDLFVKKGKIWLWVSGGDRRIITRGVGKIPVASVKFVLNEVTGPGSDFWVRKMGGERKDEPVAGEQTGTSGVDGTLLTDTNP
jgi:hypothetical protein